MFTFSFGIIVSFNPNISILEEANIWTIPLMCWLAYHVVYLASLVGMSNPRCAHVDFLWFNQQDEAKCKDYRLFCLPPPVVGCPSMYLFFFPSSSLLDRLIKFLKLCTVWYLVEVPRVWNRLLLHYSLPSFHCASEDFYDNHMAMPNQWTCWSGGN